MGENVDVLVPRNFWSRLAGRFGTKFYWQDNGQDVSIVNAVAGTRRDQGPRAVLHISLIA